MIVDKIEQYLTRNRHEHKTDVADYAEIITPYLKGMEHGFARQFVEPKDKRPTIRASSLGKCVRKQWYTMKGYDEEEIDARTNITFFMGDAIEEMVVGLSRLAGANIHSDQKEVDFGGVKGHIDGIYTENGIDYLVELKSMSDFSFKRFKDEGMNDQWGYLSQMNVYMWALGIEKGILIGVNKNTGHMHEQIISRSLSIKSQLESNISILASHETEPPPVPYRADTETFRRKPTGKYKLPIVCAYCGFKENCWKFETAIKSGRPIFYVEAE